MPPLPPEIDSKLRANARLRTPAEFAAFEDAFAQTAALNDPEVIPQVLAYLDDDAEYGEAMYAIVHLVEGFGVPTYLPFLARAVPGVARNAPRWAETLHKEILNSDAARSQYVAVLRDAPAEARSAAGFLLADLRQRKPQFGAECADVLAALV